MRMFEENANGKNTKGEELYMLKEHNGHRRHMPPHERRTLIHVEFNKEDWSLMQEIFGDEDTAAAAVTIIREAPPEVQILAVQLLDFIKEVA